jgi:hypothetical protein
LGSARRGAAESDRSDGGRAAWFVAELGSARLLAGETWRRLTRVGSGGGSARCSVADLGFAGGARRAPRSSGHRRTGTDLGITCHSRRPVERLGLAAGFAARGTRALMGQSDAFSGPASGSRARASAAATSGCAGPFLGRAACTRTVMGTARAGCGATGRARETGFSDRPVLEPPGAGLGPAQARSLRTPAAIFWRLGSACACSERAPANRRTVVGSARRSSCAEVGFME